VTLAGGFATVVVVVTAGAAVVVVVMTIGAAVVVVVVTTGAAVVEVITVGAFVVTVADATVVVVVAGVVAVDPLTGVLPAGDTLAAAGDTGVTAAGEPAGCEADGFVVVVVVSSGSAGVSAGAAGAALATRGTPLPGSTAGAVASGTVSSTRMVVSGWPGAPFFVTTCFLLTTSTDAGPPATAGTALFDGALNPSMRTPESAATDTAPVASTSTPAEAAASAFFLNMGETVTIGGLAVG
jgi:hypothetical protein